MLFNNNFNNSDYTASDYWMTVRNKLERTRKEEVATYFIELFRHFPDVIEEKRNFLYRSGYFINYERLGETK
jgi:hypothetical protein